MPASEKRPKAWFGAGGNRRRRLAWKSAIILGYASLGIVLYILSTGPYVSLADHLDSPSMMTFGESLYAPLIWLSDRSELFQDLMFQYLDLWIDFYIKPY